ncbi:MAG: polyphosphate kinase 1 [Bacteroidetes bacterium]|nr:polyphosphate kinase 1 [Bacteroidota bacterium]
MSSSSSATSTTTERAAPTGDGATTRPPEQAAARSPFTVPHATAPQPVRPDALPDAPALFFNRELSWLDFNWRVLFQAIDERTPLLERVRFLSITASNLDEFFRKRVGGLKRQQAAGVSRRSPDGRSPTEQLQLIRAGVLRQHETMHALWDELKTQLNEAAGVTISDYADLSAAACAEVDAHFQQHIFPILTPLAADPGYRFPFISHGSLSLAVVLRHPGRGSRHFARVKVPLQRGRWIPVADRPHHFVPMEQVIAHNIDLLFRGMTVESVHPFHVTRNADMRRDEEDVEDLLEMISEELRERRFASVVRLQIDPSMPQVVRHWLERELALEAEDVYTCDGLIDLSSCAALANLDLPAHQYIPWEPVNHAQLVAENDSETNDNILRIMRKQDLLVHHPYDSFRTSVQRFIEEASRDPKVLAIKQTVYRTSEDSPIIEALMRAAERGKQVAVLVEVKARFDEENNIEWGQRLEKAGAHVTYGLVGLKTHAKAALVVREEAEGLRTYCHIGTGNYNSDTARLYTDLGLLTTQEEVGKDLINLFHYLTGYAPEQHYERLIVAPRDMRRHFEDRIAQEIAHQKAHGNGRIIAKMNGLDDVQMIRSLYRASQAGVRIDLIVRGHTRIRPGLPGISENIRVRSIVGRFLEHHRIYYFGNNNDPQVYIGSADWQRRNLDDRVEAVIDVRSRALRARLVRLLRAALNDRRLAWQLHPDGTYVQQQPRTAAEAVGYHDRLMEWARRRVASIETPWDLPE